MWAAARWRRSPKPSGAGHEPGPPHLQPSATPCLSRGCPMWRASSSAWPPKSTRCTPSCCRPRA
jgi:hypothetical protein